MKKIIVFLSLISLLFTGCSVTPQTTSSTEWGDTLGDQEADKQVYIELMNNKKLKNSNSSVSRFLTRFASTHSYFEFVPVYRFNFYGDSRYGLFWERSEAIFNCSVVDDQELIRTLLKEGFQEVKTFNNEVEFAWKEFNDDFVAPIYFEQKFVVEDTTYGSKTYYNKIVICEPFNNPDAKENEKVVFYDCVYKNRQFIYEEVESSYNNRPFTCLLESSLEWKLIELDY